MKITSILLSFSLVLLNSCKENNKPIINNIENKTNLITENNISQKENMKGVCIIDEALYISLDNLFWSDSWIDEKLDEEFIYRLLISSSGEEYYIHYELFKLGEDGPSKLLKRKKVNSKDIGLEYFSSSPKVKWHSPNTVILEFEKKKYELIIEAED